MKKYLSAKFTAIAAALLLSVSALNVSSFATPASAGANDDGSYEVPMSAREQLQDNEYELPFVPTEAEHIWDEGTVTKQPTCTKAGVKTYTCTLNANHKYTESILATGHDWGEWTLTKEPTYTEAGEETRYCKNNPEHKQIREVPMLTYSKYDINGDGSENNKDIVAIFKYLSGDIVTVIEENLDVNSDGNVNNKDFVTLFRIMS